MFKNFSLGWRGSKGQRVASPLTHIVLISGTIYSYLYFLTLDREDPYRIPEPPVAAPPANAATLENFMEMDYRKMMNPGMPVLPR
jgi:hypothetical protein